MLELADTTTSHISVARVVDARPDSAVVQVELPDGSVTRADLASHLYVTPGDRVSVMTDESGSLLVFAAFHDEARSRSIPLADGVTVETSAEETVLRVRSNGRTIFEFDPATNRLHVEAGAEGLHLSCPTGDITLDAGRDLRLAGRRVTLDARESVAMTASNPAGTMTTTLTLDDARASIVAPMISTVAGVGRHHARDLEFTGSTLAAEVESASLKSKRMNIVTETVTSLATNVYQTVRKLSQLRAGRTRTLVEGTSSLKAGTVTAKATGDYSIDGTQIYLG